jgi:hypothetical protein
MSAEKSLVHVVDVDGGWLFRAGGVSALLLGLGYLVTIPLYVYVGAPPHETEAWLIYLGGKTTEWWAILALSVLTDLLFIPLALALYLALKGANRNATLLATTLVGLFVVLDLAVTWSNYAALITLGERYAGATTDAQRVSYVAAAQYPSAVLASTLEAVYSIVILSLGILLLGLVMRKAVFGKTTAYLGVVTGALGIVSVAGPFVLPALSSVIILASALTTLWVLLIGFRLLRLGLGNSVALARESAPGPV